MNNILRSIYLRLYLFLNPNNYLENRAKKAGYFENEIRFLPQLCDKDKISIDIGASKGTYSFHLLKFSKEVIAFEAFEKKYKELIYLFRRQKNIKIENYALSNKTEVEELRIPIEDTGRSTLESSNKLAEIEGEVIIQSVKCRKLDDFNFKNIGLIKVDVEGHEEAVLSGSRKTIQRESPSLIIEIEERHKQDSINNVKSFLYDRGYTGFFYKNGKFYNISHFDVIRDQSINNEEYINNFIFIHESKINNLRDLF